MLPCLTKISHQSVERLGIATTKSFGLWVFGLGFDFPAPSPSPIPVHISVCLVPRDGYNLKVLGIGNHTIMSIGPGVTTGSLCVTLRLEGKVLHQGCQDNEESVHSQDLSWTNQFPCSKWQQSEMRYLYKIETKICRSGILFWAGQAEFDPESRSHNTGQVFVQAKFSLSKTRFRFQVKTRPTWLVLNSQFSLKISRFFFC